MFESEVGVKVAATRQNAGRLIKTLPLGAVYVPAATGSAAVMVVSGNDKPARLAHIAAAADVAAMQKREVSSAAESTLAARCRPPDMHLTRALPVLQFMLG